MPNVSATPVWYIPVLVSLVNPYGGTAADPLILRIGPPEFVTVEAAFKDSFFVNAPTITSDARLKRDVEKMELGLEFVESLNPVSYRLKSESDDEPLKWGLLAQEVEHELKVRDNKSSSLVSNKDDVYGLKYEQLVMVLINAVKELSQKLNKE